ncbi:MAG: HAD-IC family P-type ATPase, partial [Bacteroidales bacterium]
EGKTVIISCDHKKVKGLIALSDTIKQESKEVIATIKKLGITPIILSGDSKASVKYTAGQLEISEYESDLLPEDKVNSISVLANKYTNVAMVGDGVNDTPALAKSSVGIAMGAAGSDSAIETSDIVILNDNIKVIEHLVELGRKTAGKIKFNIALAIGIKSIIMVTAILGYTNLALAIFADVGVTVIVVANGLSLFNYGIDKNRSI